MINFRDVAHCGSQVKIRTGVLFRAAGPDYQNDHPDLAKVHTWIDLRMHAEKLPDETHPAPKKILAPIDIADESFWAIPKPTVSDWTDMYIRAFDRLLPELVQILETILREPKPVLISCRAGKDRTGIVVALTLHLIGVERSAIVRDYCRTSEAAEELAAGDVKHLRSRGLNQQEIVHIFFTAHEPMIVGLLDHWEKDRETFADQLSRHGFTDEMSAELRELLLL